MATKGRTKGGFRVVREDGYVKVRHPDGRTVCAGVDLGPGRMGEAEFLDPADRKCNRTRQAAARALQAAGYR
jgi:hypothetical protein